MLPFAGWMKKWNFLPFICDSKRADPVTNAALDAMAVYQIKQYKISFPNNFSVLHATFFFFKRAKISNCQLEQKPLNLYFSANNIYYKTFLFPLLLSRSPSRKGYKSEHNSQSRPKIKKKTVGCIDTQKNSLSDNKFRAKIIHQKRGNK